MVAKYITRYKVQSIRYKVQYFYNTDARNTCAKVAPSFSLYASFLLVLLYLRAAKVVVIPKFG